MMDERTPQAGEAWQVPAACAMALHLRSVAGAKPFLVVNGAPGGVSPGLVQALARECQQVVAVDSGLRWVHEAAIAADAIVGDMDSVDPAVLAACTQPGVVIERHRPEKDQTDIELALAYAGCAGARACLVANVFGGRIDHELATIGALARAARDGLGIAALDDAQALVFLAAGHAVALRDLGLEPGDEYGVVAPLGAARLSQSGVAYPQQSGVLDALSGLGVSNVVASPDAIVRVGDGLVALIIGRGRA